MDSVFIRTTGFDLQTLLETLLLREYNTRVVVIGTTLLGMAAGAIGTFMLLRKRSLVGDAVSHAALPGIGIAYILMQALFGNGKYLPGLLLGALVAGLLGMGCILLIRHRTPLKEDASIGIVLSVFFGAGIALLGVIQKMRTGHAAGLESFIYGKTASMIRQDALMIAAASFVIFLSSVLFVKELSIVSFDQEFARAEGYPVLWLDVLVLGLAVLLTVIGLQAVGLILIIALLIIPAASARFWTHRLSTMVTLSAVFGAISGFFGSALSATVPNLPAGAVIVLVSGAILVLSIVVGSGRGLLTEGVRLLRYGRRLALHKLAVAIFRVLSARPHSAGLAIGFGDLTDAADWTPLRLRLLLVAARRRGLVRRTGEGAYQVTSTGLRRARRAARNHELQHLYLRAYPEMAQGLHQRDEENVEDFIDPDALAVLNTELSHTHPELYREAQA